MIQNSTPAGPLEGGAMDGPPQGWLPKLIALLDEQCALCAGLDGLSKRQSGAVAEGDTDALLRILGERQIVIDRVEAVNKMLEPFRSGKERVLARLAPSERERVTERVERLGAIVDAVRARDDGDRRLLESRRGAVANELAGLSRGRGAVSAYAGSMTQPGPKYQDRQG